jgi:transcriptional regulator GlxA family with amidase domain
LTRSATIERAKAIFWDSPWFPVAAVAVAVGYQDPTTFGRAFKRYEG